MVVQDYTVQVQNKRLSRLMDIANDVGYSKVMMRATYIVPDTIVLLQLFFSLATYNFIMCTFSTLQSVHACMRKETKRKKQKKKQRRTEWREG